MSQEPQGPRAPAWHTLPVAELLAALEAREHGLTSEEARVRLEHHGPNALPHAEQPSPLRILLRQFNSPLIYVLAAAAAVSLGLGHLSDAGFILAVIAINAAIGGAQEWGAEKSSRALQQLLRTHAVVLRDGDTRSIDGEEVVPGDLVVLEPGNRVPADLRLLGSHALEIDESLLTGESLVVAKEVAWSGSEDTPVGDRRNMAHAGSVVARGRGRGVVVATGADSALGQLSIGVGAGPGGKPPLVERMERFSRVIGLAVLVAAALTGILGVAWMGYGIADMFLLAVALAVAAIPEGLPVSMTVALSVATRRMARRGVIVRRLAAVEGLGSCTLIASDKTGTLTANELTVQVAVLASGRRLRVTGSGYAPLGEVLADGGQPIGAELRAELEGLARAAALCNEASLVAREQAWAWHGDPTDVALLSFARKADLHPDDARDELPQVHQIPFEPERRYSATFHQAADGVHVLVKGAPERVLEMCTGDVRLEEASRAAARLAEEGFRVLALAQGRFEGAIDPAHPPPEPARLEYLGLTGMIDALRPGVREAVDDCHRAGITVIMVTGDHPVTALAIARDLHLAERSEEVVTGAELARMGPEELRESLAIKRVFARTAPQQKLEIVDAARASGHFVAVTGDGVNDAPALRAANIGVAMGRSGTDVAREASELLISDDNFATIVSGIAEGRVAYDNIRKVIYLLVSTGAAEVVLVALSLVLGLPLPLTAVQLLWLNLVTNGIQDKALAFEPPEGDVLARRPRPPRESIFNRLMIERTLLGGAWIGLVGIVNFYVLLELGWSEGEARNVLLLLMVLFENFHIGNSRSETRSVFAHSPLRSPLLVLGVLAAFGVHMLAMYWGPLQRVLGTAPVGGDTFLTMLALALTVVFAMELHKLSWRMRHGRGES